jgi:hypothetical protein
MAAVRIFAFHVTHDVWFVFLPKKSTVCEPTRGPNPNTVTPRWFAQFRPIIACNPVCTWPPLSHRRRRTGATNQDTSSYMGLDIIGALDPLGLSTQLATSSILLYAALSTAQQIKAVLFGLAQ